VSGLLPGATVHRYHAPCTYFVVGHFHMVMGVAAMFGIFAGTYFWFPKMTGRMMNETPQGSLLAKLRGAYCIFMPFHYLGLAGNVRRYSSFVDDFLQPLYSGASVLSPSLRCSPCGPVDLPLQPDSQPVLGASWRRTITLGKPLHWSGAPPRRRLLTISAVSTLWFITTISIRCPEFGSAIT